MLVKCLYCDVETDALATAGYCDNCGKKLPTSAMVRTKRALAGNDGDDHGRVLSQRSPVVEALLAAAVVQLVAGGLFLVLGPMLLARVPTDFLATVVVWALVPALALAGLMVLARRQARFAVLTALAGYAVWVAVGYAWQPDVAVAWLLVHAVMAAMLVWVGWVGLRST